MQDYGLVSIITHTWACADFIVETIRSIQAQTYQNWELLIQDGCSTDGTYKVVEPYLEGTRIKSNVIHKMPVSLSHETMHFVWPRASGSLFLIPMIFGCLINWSIS